MTEPTRPAQPSQSALALTGLFVLGAGLTLMVSMSVNAAGDLPSTIILEGSSREGADIEVPRPLLLALFPFLALVIGTIGLLAQRIRSRAAARLGLPVWRRADQDRRSVNLGLGLLIPVLTALHVFLIEYAQGGGDRGQMAIALVLGVVAMVLGNLLPTTPTMSDGTASSLAMEEHPVLDDAAGAIRRSYRSTGVAMMVLGFAAVVAAPFSVPLSLLLSFLAVLVMGGATGMAGIRGAAGSRRR